MDLHLQVAVGHLQGARLLQVGGQAVIKVLHSQLLVAQQKPVGPDQSANIAAAIAPRGGQGRDAGRDTSMLWLPEPLWMLGTQEATPAPKCTLPPPIPPKQEEAEGWRQL